MIEWSFDFDTLFVSSYIFEDSLEEDENYDVR